MTEGRCRNMIKTAFPVYVAQDGDRVKETFFPARFDDLRNFMFVRIADDVMNAPDRLDVIRCDLRITTGYNDPCARVVAHCPADGLPGLHRSFPGDGAGVDHAQVGTAVVPRGEPSEFLQTLCDGFRFGLVDFATQCGN